MEFLPGDKVRRKNGNSFSDGITFVVTVDRADNRSIDTAH